MTVILDEPITEAEIFQSCARKELRRILPAFETGSENTLATIARKAEVKAYFDNIRFTHIDINGTIGVKWSAVGIGGGELLMYSDADLLMIDNECMSKEFLKKLFCKIIDQSALSDEPFDNDK